MSHETLTLNEARRIALTAQGFDLPRPDGKVNAGHIRGAIRRLGLVQIDYVNVLTPAHYQILFSRLGSYKKSLFDDLVYGRREFTEQWAHERSILPVESWPLLRHRMETHRVRPWGFEKFLEQQSSYVAWALEEIRARGPLGAEDLPEPDGAPSRMSDKWGWGMNIKNQVLEAHFGYGRLAVAERLPNFTRVYDLAERVIPAEQRGRTAWARLAIWPIITACRFVTLGCASPNWLKPGNCARRRWKGGRNRPIFTRRRASPGGSRPRHCCRRSTPWSGIARARRDSSGSITASRYSRRRRSAAGAITCCHSCWASVWSPASISKPTAPRAGCSRRRHTSKPGPIPARSPTRWPLSCGRWRRGWGWTRSSSNGVEVLRGRSPQPSAL